MNITFVAKLLLCFIVLLTICGRYATLILGIGYLLTQKPLKLRYFPNRMILVVLFIVATFMLSTSITSSPQRTLTRKHKPRTPNTLSVVVAYQGHDKNSDTISRFQLFINMLAYHSNERGATVELIVVDWTPRTESKTLVESLTLPKSLRSANFITVPASVYTKAVDNKNLREYVAKNIGARRATGDWILFTNPSNVWSAVTWDQLANLKSLKKDEVYLMRPTEVITDSTLFTKDVSGVETFLSKNVDNPKMARLQRSEFFSKTWLSFKFLVYRAVFDYYFTAHLPYYRPSSDFMLVHHNAFFELRGFDEELHGPYTQWNTVFICKAMAFGLKQVIWNTPNRMYHIDGEPLTKQSPDSSVRNRLCSKMLGNRDPFIKKTESEWGLPYSSFTNVKCENGVKVPA